MRTGVSVALLTAAMILTTVGEAPALDLHRYWDQRCGECHGHAGAFARRFLSVRDGELQGRHPVGDMRLFLRNHGVPAGEVDAVYAMLLAQASSPGGFDSRCGSCHGSAAELARGSLVLRDGVLRGVRSSRPVAEFLRDHAGLRPEEVTFFTDLLTRVEREVNRP
jgi:hypothetical protein